MYSFLGILFVRVETGFGDRMCLCGNGQSTKCKEGGEKWDLEVGLADGLNE